MKKSLNYLNFTAKAVIFLILVSFPIFISTVDTQINNLQVRSSTTMLVAESNNDVSIFINNDFEPIYELFVSVSFPSSIQDPASPNLIGAHDWKFDKVDKGDEVEILLTIFVPEDAAGNAYTANIILTYKRLGYISPYTESHTLGFYAQGWIDIIFYEIDMEPTPVQPGKSISFSANILNKGNIPAMFTNISLLENENLILQPESYSYLGQIDPNSPAPFTLEAIVRPEVEEGNYSTVILVSYEDDNNVPHIVSRRIQFNVVELIVEEATQGPIENIKTFITNYQSPQFFLTIIIILIIIICIGILARRRQSKIEDFEV